ncbi:hypothetical protein Ssi03_56670 [Sphaerisporangium siamense]|nr:hypothetical protein Ssi03_56670 [Sphaerisporangium siamense]
MASGAPEPAAPVRRLRRGGSLEKVVLRHTARTADSPALSRHPGPRPTVTALVVSPVAVLANSRAQDEPSRDAGRTRLGFQPANGAGPDEATARSMTGDRP